MLPYFIIVKDGMAHHLEAKGWRTQDLFAEIGKILNDEQRYEAISEPMKSRRNSLTIYWEYAKKEVGKILHVPLKQFVISNLGRPEVVQYMEERITYGEKMTGYFWLTHLILPVVGAGFLFVYFMLTLVCGCCSFNDVDQEEEEHEKEE